ncbi:MAG TPA: FAD:protein FMN transferase [bacterium]|nr:FAD:protein FMN transferase [bacterium]
MNKQLSDLESLQWDWETRPDIHRYSHHAMATTYEIYVQHDDEHYAEGAAYEAFKLIDKLEEALSRFIENSDISRINSLQAYEFVTVGLPAFECLEISKNIYEETDRAFDISIGPLYQCWLTKDKTLRNPSQQELNSARYRTGMHLVKLNKSNYTVQVLRSNLHLDLGGVGKGYAVDKVGELFREWNIENALIHGGKSSVLALEAPSDMPGWPVTISRVGSVTKTVARLFLHNHALSGSGIHKGQHILDPRRGEPVKEKSGAWALADSSAMTDALSTAFMIMSPEAVRAYCESHENIRAIAVPEGDETPGSVQFFGDWDEVDFPLQVF